MTKLFLAYPEDYIEEAAACGAKGLLFHDDTLRKKNIKIKTLMNTHWPAFTPRPSIAIVYDGETVELDDEKHSVYFYEQPMSDFKDLLDAGERLIFCEGYSGLVNKPGKVAVRWVNHLLREAQKVGAGIHLMNIYGLKPLLDFDIASADVLFKIAGDQSYVILPTASEYRKQSSRNANTCRGFSLSG